MKISFSSSFLEDLERIDNVVAIDGCTISGRNYKPQVVNHNGVVQACIVGVEVDECDKLDFYYNDEHKLAFTITSDSPIRLNRERTIFKFNLLDIGRPIRAEITCSWLTEDTKFIESIGLDLGYSLYKDIEISSDTLIWKNSIGKYIVDRGLQDDHRYNAERLDTKSGILEDRPIRFKSYQNIIIDPGNWKIDYEKRTIVQKHDVYSEISSSVFYVWDSPMIDAKVNYNVEPECIERLGEYLDPGNIVFGNTDCFQFINFQSGVLKGFRITGTEESEIEFLFNREYASGPYTSFRAKIGKDRVVEIKIPEDLLYTHLNGIITVGPSKITKIETIQYIEEPVDIIIPNLDSTYVVEIGNSDCIVQINASCDYIEYEKYLGKITEIGRGTEHINSIPGVEIIISEKGDGGLDSKINQLERQIECYYNSSTYESVHTDIFQVIIDKNIIVSGDSIGTERLVSDYKIKIEQTGIVWRITNSPDYTYTEELIGGTRNYGIFLLDFPQNSSRTLEIITNQLDYTDDLIIVADEHVNNTFTFNPVRRIPPAEERGWLIDGEYWNIYDLTITTNSENENEEWTPQVEGSQQNPYIVKIKYGLSNEIIESLSFCAIQLGKIEPKISIWEETLPGKFTKVEDGKMTIFDSLVKNFIVVRSHKEDDPEDHNWYYYDLNGTNKFFLTDFNSTTNVGIVFLDYFNKTTLDIGTGEDRVKFGRIINVNRSDLIGSLGVLTVTENSSYPGSWRELINNNTANVEIFREKTNIYIEVGTGDNLENKDLTLEVSKIGIYSIKVRSNYKYIIETNNSGYFRFIDETSTTQTSESLNDNIKKEVYKGYNSIIEYKLALVRLDQEEGMGKTYIEIRSGTLVRRINVVVKDPVYASHSYLTEITTVNEGAIETQEIEKPNIIRIYENGSLTPQENVNFYYSSYTTPKIDYSNLANVSDTTSSSFIYYSDLKDYVYHKSSVNFTVPNSLSLSYSKYPIKSFGGINESSLSFSSLEGNPLEYLFYMKGKGHYLWGVDNISDFSDIGNVNDDTFKDITFDASGTQGRDVYVISRYSINNKTFTTEYPEISEINIKRNDLEATLTILPQQKISLDAKSQIEYAIPIHATCNIVNNQGNVFIGSLTYKAETKVTDASLEDVIEIPSNIIDQELGGSEEEIKNYLTNYILGVGETHKLPKQEFTLRIFQRGTSTDSLSIFSDISDFGVNESTKYIIPEVGSNRDVSDVEVKVNDKLIIPTDTIDGLTFTEEHSSSYFLVTAHEDDLIGDDGQYWYTDLPGDDVIKTKTFNISISFLSDKNKDFSYTKTIKKYGYNYGLLVNNGVSTWFGFGNAKSEKNKNAWSPAISIPAEGGKVLIKAGIFYAVDGKQSTEALSIPFEYKFVGENIPDNVVWEGGNLDELNEFDEPGGNLYITVPPRLRDDFGEKHFILQVTQPHEYYPLNLYVDFAQKSFYEAETKDTDQDNYKLVFEKKELNVYSNGQVEGETDKIYFTHNLNEEAFNRVEFDWVGRIITRRVTPKEGEPYEEEKQTYIPFSPDDLSFLEEVERNYKDGYVKFKFKPNGSREFIYAKLRAKYRKKDDTFIVLGEMEVNQGYYCINATYVNPYMKSKISNFIYLSTNMSRISPKALIAGLIPGEINKAYYFGECPCYTNNNNLNASGSDSFIKGRGVIYIKAYRLEFYQNDNNNIVEVDSEGIEKDEKKYETGEDVLKIFNNIDILNNTNSNVLDSLNAILISDPLVNDFDARVSDRFKIGSSIYVTSTNFSDIKEDKITIYTVPYIDIIYKCKEDYIRERATISVSCKVSLIEEDSGNNSDFYFTLSSIKEASNEPPSIDSLTVNPTKLMFDYRGGQKQISFSPTSMRDMITVTMIPDKDNWITVTPAASNSNFITFTATENKSTDSKTAYYRTCQAKLDIEDSRDHYLLKSFLIDIEQQSDTSGSGSGGGGDDPDPPTPTGDVNIKLKLVNDRTDKDLELNGEVIIYVDDGEGYHVGINANIPGYDITQNNLIVAKGTSSETFSITCAKTESVNPVEYLGNSIDFVHSKEGCKAYTMNGGGHDSDIYKPYKVSILEGGVTFEKNKTYIITFHEEGAGTAPNLPLMSDFNEVLTTELNKEKVTLEYTPKTSDYLTSAMNLATSEWNSGSLFNIVNETGVDIVNYRGSNSSYEENAKTSMYAWLYAMCLSEIIPSYSSDMITDNNQTILYKKAYDLGGYELGGGRNIPLYGNFTPKGDCMVARLVAGILWAKNRSGYSFNDLDTMRSELGGQIIDKPDTPWTDFGYVDNTRIGWLVNLDKIFPAAPGPFANGYDNGRVRPSSQGQDYSLFFSPSESQYNWWSENYKIDVSIDNTVVSGYNLQMEDVDLSRTVQAVADDTEDVTHMFGEKTYYKYDATKTTVVDGITVQGPRFTFTPGTPTDNNGFFYGTFGSEVTGVDLSSILSSGNDDTETDFSYFMGRSRYIGSHGRYPLLNPQYGRRRPSQGLENPSSRDTSNYRLNWLDDTTIAKLVGSGTKYDANGQDYNLYWDDINGNGKYDVRHLNSDGEWVDAEPFYNDGITETEEDLFHTLYANTYPSGHSSGVWGTALCTTLFFPDKYKEIFRAAYKFSVSRTIVRAHWNSDITYGRTIGTMIIPISHAIRYNNSRYGNYRTLYENALKQATGGGGGSDDEKFVSVYNSCKNYPQDSTTAFYHRQTADNPGFITFNITNNSSKRVLYNGRFCFHIVDSSQTYGYRQCYGHYREPNSVGSNSEHYYYTNPTNYVLEKNDSISIVVPIKRYVFEGTAWVQNLEGERLFVKPSLPSMVDYFRLYFSHTENEDDFPHNGTLFVDQTGISESDSAIVAGKTFNLSITDVTMQDVPYYLPDGEDYNKSKQYVSHTTSSGKKYMLPMRLSDWS